MVRLTARSAVALAIDVALLLLCIAHIPSVGNRARIPFVPMESRDTVRVGQILDEPAAGGLRSEDEFLALDGQRVTSERDPEFLADFHAIGDTLRAVVWRAGALHTTTVRLIPAYSAVYIAVILFVGVVTWLVGVFVLLARPRNLTAAVLHWALISMGISVMIMLGSMREPDCVTYIARLVFFIVYMNVAVSFLLFTTLFPSPMPGSVLRRSLLLYAPAMCVVGGVLYFHLHALVSDSLAAYGVGRSLYDLFHILILVYVGFGILNFIRSFRRTADPVERKKLQWILWGLAIGPGPFLLLVTVVELFIPLSPVPEEYTLVFFVLIPITFAISLIRYHLLDIEIVISRTTVYAMVFGIVVAVYLCVVAIAAFIVGSASPPAYAVGAVLVALLFEPARVRVQRFVDRRFFRVRYDFRLAERKFLGRIEHCVDVQQLADLLVGDTDALIPLQRIGFFRVEEPGHRLRCLAHRGFDMLERRGVSLEPERLKTRLEIPVALTERIEPGIAHEPADPDVFHRWGMVIVFPMLAEGPTLLGFLVLGEKKSGARFTSEDVDLMRNVAAQAGLEVQRIMLQQQLMEKQAEARHLAELNQLKSDFVSYVSHEFRTPLTSIRMYAELLGTAAGRVGAKGQEFIRVIEGETERLDRMVTTVLDSAKIDRGVKHYRFEKSDLRTIADQVLAMMSYQLKKHRFRVDYRPGRGPAPFIADADAVGQAMMNLISNSIKYSGGRRKVSVALTRNARWVSCAVSDCGQGISREALPRLFEKFYRDPARSSGVQGVGLGLPLVKHIMDAHGGAVLVKSTPGKGSTFTLRFPVRGPSHGTNNEHPGGGG